MRFPHIRHPLIFAMAFLVLNSCTRTENSAKETPTDSMQMVKAPGKNDLLLLTDRPPNLETPLHYFLLDYTPNEVFFVRWHLSNIPLDINPDTFHLRIGGAVKKELSLSLKDLRSNYSPVTVTALAECAGNARSFFDPAVPGAQWKNGGMGNAKWTGVPLKKILESAGLKPGSREISFNGMDAPPLPSVADFVKSLPLNVCMDENVLVAYEMNGEKLPALNGFPLKLVVPGYYATYWVGMLNEIRVYTDTFKGYWMDKAYRVPKGVRNGDEKPDSLATATEPMGKLDVRSIFVAPEPGEKVRQHAECNIQGLAFDGGDGIEKVELSSDSGKHWMTANLSTDLGRFSWRRWHFFWQPQAPGKITWMVKATNAKGETQPFHQWNRSGYLRNEIEKLEIVVE